ncbi:MAG: hypothetical protein AMJ53_16565 [Gammaproteobacteria bacterium SG8_11]|nr:MAG: hypothetical protein AMJ53_16565 [Gammaproteobacteria bacterium SG8_11]
MKDWGEKLIQQYWAAGLDKRLPVIATLIGIVLIANSFAALTWKLVPVPDFPDAAIAVNKITRPAGAQARSAAGDQPVAAKISQYHLFGKFEKKIAPPPVQAVATAPETLLNLKLRGVFSSQDKELARAIIADAKGEDESYAIGDEVPGGAILNDIFEDRVILERNGQLETLKLPVESLPGDTTTAVSGGLPPRGGNRVSPAPAAAIDTATADTSEILRHYRDALINDPQSVMGLVRVQPYNKDGKLEGYRIRPGKDRQLLTKFGLRSGDVVKAVNGVPMDNPIKALEILRDLSTANSVTVDIERNGTPRSFTFQIQ